MKAIAVVDVNLLVRGVLSAKGQATHLISEDNDLHQDPVIPIFLSQRGIQLVHLGDFLRAIAVDV